MSIGEVFYAIILYPIVQVIEVAYKLFSQLFNNTGIAIMGVSFVVTVLCLPLYIVAERWQQLERDTQARLKGGVDRIKAVFKGDEQYMILSTYYRQNHYHPMMALRSSFGLLIQVPFFMAAYSCLSNLPALQGQSFLFIRDMGAPDALFSIGGFEVNVLPMAMTAINIVAGAIYTKGFPFKEKAQIYGMALLFLVLLYNSPAGLVLYWTMNNVFSLVKNIFYKLKRPVRVLYILMCTGVILADIYILFIYGGSASITKRLAAVIPFSCLLLAPQLVRGVNWLLDNWFVDLVNTPPPIKLRVFIPVALAWALLSGLVLPSSLIASSVSEFSDIGSYGNPAMFLWYSCFQSLGLFVFWPLCIFFLFKEKIQTLLTILFSMGFVCSVVNAFLFLTNYGSMDIALVFENSVQATVNRQVILNACVMLCLCILVFILLAKTREKWLSSFVIIGILSFVIFSFLNLTSINKSYSQYQHLKKQNDSAIHGMEPVFNFTKTGQNVVIIMLDRASSAYLQPIFNDQPELYEMFDGFTYYENTLSFAPKTLTSSPAIHGGYEYTPVEMNKRSDIRLKEKHNEALLLVPRILTENADFNASLYDSSWGNYSYQADMSFTNDYGKINGYALYNRYDAFAGKNLGVEVLVESLERGLKRNLLWVSLLRCTPIAIRPIVYYRGSYFNPEVIDTGSAWGWFSALYTLPYVTDFTVAENSLMVMTNEMTHEVLNNDSLLSILKNPLSYPEYVHYRENTLALMALGKWFESLQENGVYDNTRIIIVSDHGIGSMHGQNFSYPEFDVDTIQGFSKDYLHSLLLYKDFGDSGSLKTDSRFMTTADVPILAMEGIVENPVNPFTGNSVELSKKKDGVFVTTHVNLWAPEHSKSEYIFTVPDDSWYHVKDNIFIDSNWTQEVPQ